MDNTTQSAIELRTNDSGEVWATEVLDGEIIGVSGAIHYSDYTEGTEDDIEKKLRSSIEFSDEENIEWVKEETWAKES